MGLGGDVWGIRQAPVTQILHNFTCAECFLASASLYLGHIKENKWHHIGSFSLKPSAPVGLSGILFSFFSLGLAPSPKQDPSAATATDHTMSC